MMDLKERARNLKADIPALFFAVKDKDTPIMAKILAGVMVAYALSPIDLIPDFIPILGYLDDIILLPALIALTIRLIPKSVMERNRRVSEELWKNGKQKNWCYAIPIIVVWSLVLIVIIKVVFL